MNKSGIYGIFNMIDGKVLVGSTINFKHRWHVHLYTAQKGRHGNPFFQHAWNKYGESSFEFRVLEECDADMLLLREDAWMSYYNSLNEQCGYNLKNAARTIFSKATRGKMSRSASGYQNTNYGKPKSEAWKKMMSEARKGRSPSLETRAKIAATLRGRSSWNKGKPWSEEVKKKLSISHMGQVPSQHQREVTRRIHTGKVVSAETRRKTSETLKMIHAQNPETLLLRAKHARDVRAAKLASQPQLALGATA